MNHNFTEPTPVNSNVLIIFVFIDVLDIEDSTAPPPAVGSNTTWLLRFDISGSPDAAAFPGHPTWMPELRALRYGGITAYVDNPPAGPVETSALRGTFTGTMIGGSIPDQLPTTTGSIIGLQVRSDVYREARPHHWMPVPGSTTLERVSRSPKWFDRSDMTTGTDWRRDTGLIMQIAVQGVV